MEHICSNPKCTYAAMDNCARGGSCPRCGSPLQSHFDEDPADHECDDDVDDHDPDYGPDDSDDFSSIEDDLG